MISRALLFVAVLLAFGASLTHGFHFDDYSLIHGVSWSAWHTRPLTWLSFAVNARLSNRPAAWHLVSFVVHFCAVLLLYQLFLKLLSPMAALLGAAVFAVHPIQAEAVAYVFSRATLFSTALSLSTCLLWIKGWRWTAVGCFALALMGKEDCITLPFVIVLFELPRLRGKWAAIGIMLVLSIAAGVNTLIATAGIVGSGAGFSSGVNPMSYLLDEGYVILRYLRLLLVPYGFTIDPALSAGYPLTFASWMVVAILVCLAVRTKNKWALAGMILLLPSSSIFPLADLAADHRMYLPMAAFAGCAGIWLARLPRYAGVLIILALIGVSAMRMNVWASDEKLWTEAMERAPDKLRPRIQLSRALEPARALPELQSAQRKFPGNTEVDAELGRVYLQKGQPATALAEFGKVLGRHPSDAYAINNRGVALRALGQEDAAKQDFAGALKVDPCLMEARENLGLPACR